MKTIELTQGQVAVVDDEDYELLSGFKWYASFGSRNRKWYAVRRRAKSERLPGMAEKISMHRFLMEPAPGFVVDHVNGNSLDNRRSNLEVVTQEVNMERVANWKRKAPDPDSITL